MRDFIVTLNGKVVAKYRQIERPEPLEGEVQEVDNLNNHQIEESVSWFPY